MKVVRKINGRLVELGEGRIYSKSQLMLKEDGVDANIGMANNVQQARMKAKQLMNKNPNVSSASADAGKIDGQTDAQGGEGMKLQVPVNATGAQLAQVQNTVKRQDADDVQIEFTKDNPSDSTASTNESRIMEMRKNAISFRKDEFTKFIREINS